MLLIVQQQPSSAVAVTPDVCHQSAPVGATPDELKLDLSSLATSAQPAARSPSLPQPRPPRTAPPLSYATQTTVDDDDDDDDDAGGPSADEQTPGAVAGALRDHIASMAKRFVEDGRAVRRAVLEYLHRSS